MMAREPMMIRLSVEEQDAEGGAASGALVNLDHLARRIDAEHTAAAGAARTAIEHAIACGRLLLEAKATVAHGEWLPWLEAHTAVTPRQSQTYMRLAQNGAAVLAANAKSTSHLTIEVPLAETGGFPR